MNHLTNSELLRAVMNEPDATPAERLLADRLWEAMEKLDGREESLRQIKSLMDEAYDHLP